AHPIVLCRNNGDDHVDECVELSLVGFGGLGDRREDRQIGFGGLGSISRPDLEEEERLLSWILVLLVRADQVWEDVVAKLKEVVRLPALLGDMAKLTDVRVDEEELTMGSRVVVDRVVVGEEHCEG